MMTPEIVAARRLHQAVEAVAPISMIALGTFGDSSSVRIEFTPTATPQQRAAARAAVDGFDWSQAAQDAWVAALVPERKDLRDQAAQAVADLDAFLAITSPTQVQTLAVVRKLCQQNKRIIARLIQVD